MQTYYITVRAKTDSLSLLRLRGPGGELIGERELQRKELDDLVEEVEQSYRVTFGFDLLGLGQRLYEWLDGTSDRWLEEIRRSGADGITLLIDVQDRLRHLPWEILATADGFVSVNPHRLFTPVRRVRQGARSSVRMNRPLRLLFSACSPEGVLPVLDFEGEERRILEACQTSSIELVVDESGSLAGLQMLSETFDVGHFDVVHLSGHAYVGPDGPRFVMEDELGFRNEAAPNDIGKAFSGRMPRLLFLSGCHTGRAAGQGGVPSMCESLVSIGIPAVLGWALPVGDRAASIAEAELYEQLSIGKKIDEALALARIKLYELQSPFWHLLRLYTDESELAPLVTAPGSEGRERLRGRAADAEFLDAGQVVVCPREKFVGRRRALQQALRTLKAREKQNDYAEGVLVHGMGGYGKSSLAARLCERLARHRRVVVVGAFDEMEFIKRVGERLDDGNLGQILNAAGLSLLQRVRRIFEGPLQTSSVLFIFDDFEHNLELSPGSPPRVKPEPLQVIRALLSAIRESASESRVIVTSRYTFPLPGPARLAHIGLEPFRGADLAKKVKLLQEGGTTVAVTPELREKTVALAAGNPRLLERLFATLRDESIDTAVILDKLEGQTESYREEIFLNALLHQQGEMFRRFLARLSVFSLPVSLSIIKETLAATGRGEPAEGVQPSTAPETEQLERDLERAVALSLVDGGYDPATRRPRYSLSPLMVPLVSKELTADERKGIFERGGQALYRMLPDKLEEVKEEALLHEVHRLALLGGLKEIAVRIGWSLVSRMEERERFREAEAICSQTLAVFDDYDLLERLANAKSRLGKKEEACEIYREALSAHPGANPSEGERHQMSYAICLSNYAHVLEELGRLDEALDYYGQALALVEESEDLYLRGILLYNYASVLIRRGNEEGMKRWEEALELIDRSNNELKQKEHAKANIYSDTAKILVRLDNVPRALELWEKSLKLAEHSGDDRLRALTLKMMADTLDQQGGWQQALPLLMQALEILGGGDFADTRLDTLEAVASISTREKLGDSSRLWDEVLSLREEIGGREGKVKTLTSMVRLYFEADDYARAADSIAQVLEIKTQTGDDEGRAVALINLASVKAAQGDVSKASEIWDEALAFSRQHGFKPQEAIILHHMARASAAQDDLQRSCELWNQALDITADTEDYSNEIDILHTMAMAVADKGDLDQATSLLTRAMKVQERTDDVVGRALSLILLSNISGRKGQTEEQRARLLQAANLLATRASWENLAETLFRLGVLEDEDSVSYLAQAFWLCMHTKVSTYLLIRVTDALVRSAGPEKELKTRAVIYVLHKCLQLDPQMEKLKDWNLVLGMIQRCASEDGVNEDSEIVDWLQSKQENGFKEHFRALETSLESIAGEDKWLFDRTRVRDSQGWPSSSLSDLVSSLPVGTNYS